ncbi:MAG: universal stress protein [Desulfatibacillaceae bacterium]
MLPQILHVFRNTPLGRETYLQTLYFCRQLDAGPNVYIPEHTKFLMYFEDEVLQVDLDSSYLSDLETARLHVEELTSSADLSAKYVVPKEYTASTLPDVPTQFDFMCCPRSMSDVSGKMGLGHIGPKVRRIVKGASFPILIPSIVYKEWQRLAVMFGGSPNSLRALRLGLAVQRRCGMPLDLFTYEEKGREEAPLREILDREGLTGSVQSQVREWSFFKSGLMENDLYEVPHDALVILGAYGHGVIKDLLFGSRMEVFQSHLPNSFLVVGPRSAITI